MSLQANNIHSKPTQKVGFVVKTHGFKGQLKLELDEDFIPEDFLLLAINQKFVPYQIESFNDQASIVKLKDIDNEEMASQLTGLDILDFIDEVLDAVNYNQFELVNLQDNKSYQITNTIEMPSQILLEIRVEYKDVLIPLHQDLGLRIDEDEKKIYLNFPEGILDL